MTREEFSEVLEAIKVAMNCNAFTIGNCGECPLHCANDIGCGNVEDIFDIIDDVEDWVEKHRKETKTWK